jgi:hypothetical protein
MAAGAQSANNATAQQKQQVAGERQDLSSLAALFDPQPNEKCRSPSVPVLLVCFSKHH